MGLSGVEYQSTNHLITNAPREPSTARPPHYLRIAPYVDPSAHTLHFEPVTRDVRAGGAFLRIGRFTDRVGAAARQPDSTKIGFRSKVVSRAHAEIWCAPNGKFMICNTRSSSDTFLNHTPLSAPNIESRPSELHDGDIVQLGLHHHGGNEEIYRCIKIRDWSKDKGKDKARPSGGSAIAGPSNSRKTSVADCRICLFPVAILQSLFIAPLPLFPLQAHSSPPHK
ncbi:unnamed protein product, partial [Rhizoctonia solani]